MNTSDGEGMGAVSRDNGTFFRVWAPNADAVCVAGTFNNWSENADPLTPEGNGYWAGAAAAAGPGDEYRYLIANGDRLLWRIDPYARAVTNSAGNAVISPSDKGSPAAFQPPPWNEMVIYEMHVGTFARGPGGEDGDLDDVTRRIGYLGDLGVNALELMPVTEFAGSRSWGYNPSCCFAIESDYGGPAAFRALVETAHANGIAVILDVVYNHFGPSDLGLWQFDGWSAAGKGGIYFYNDRRAKTPWGDTRPDYGRDEVRQYLRDNALMWFEEYGIDGLRWDATAFIRNVAGNNDDPAGDIPEGWSLMQWINDEVHRRFPGRISIAEDLRGNAAITADTARGGAGFDAQWDASFVRPVRAALTAVNDADRVMATVRDAVCHRYNPDVFERVIYTESHDEVADGTARVPEQIHPGKADSRESKKRSVLGAVLVFTSPGVPMMFQGQELLEDRWFHEEDPVDWARLEPMKGIRTLYGDLIRLRRNLDGVSRGFCGQNVNVFHLDEESKMIAFHRWERGGPEDDVVVLLNLADRACDDVALGFPRGGEWKVRFNSDWRGYDQAFGGVGCERLTADGPPLSNMPCSGHLPVGAYGAIVLSQDSPGG